MKSKRALSYRALTADVMCGASRTAIVRKLTYRVLPCALIGALALAMPDLSRGSEQSRDVDRPVDMAKSRFTPPRALPETPHVSPDPVRLTARDARADGGGLGPASRKAHILEVAVPEVASAAIRESEFSSLEATPALEDSVLGASDLSRAFTGARGTAASGSSPIAIEPVKAISVSSFKPAAEAPGAAELRLHASAPRKPAVQIAADPIEIAPIGLALVPAAKPASPVGEDAAAVAALSEHQAQSVSPAISSPVGRSDQAETRAVYGVRKTPSAISHPPAGVRIAKPIPAQPTDPAAPTDFRPELKGNPLARNYSQGAAALDRLDVKAQLVARIDGRVAGKFDFRQDGQTISIRLGSIVDLLKDRFEPTEVERFGGAAASNAYLSLAQLNAAGVPVSYDPVYDEFFIGAKTHLPVAAHKVQIDQITDAVRDGNPVAIEQIAR